MWTTQPLHLRNSSKGDSCCRSMHRCGRTDDQPQLEIESHQSLHTNKRALHFGPTDSITPINELFIAPVSLPAPWSSYFPHKNLSRLWSIKTILLSGSSGGKRGQNFAASTHLTPNSYFTKEIFYSYQPSVQSAPTPISLYTSAWLPLVPGSQQAWACSQLTLKLT